MSAWSSILIVAIVGVMTYSMRAVVIVAMAHRTIPPSLDRVLRYVGPAVLAALAINLAAGGEGGPNLSWPEALALVVAALVAWRSKNLIASLVAGMVALWIATWLG